MTHSHIVVVRPRYEHLFTRQATAPMCGASIGLVRSFFEFSWSFLDRVSSLDFVLFVDKHEMVVTIVVIIGITYSYIYIYVYTLYIYIYIYIYCVYIVYIPSAPFDI